MPTLHQARDNSKKRAKVKVGRVTETAPGKARRDVVKISQKVYHFFTVSLPEGRGVVGFAWTGLDWLGLNRIGVTELWSVGVRPGGRIGGLMDWWIDGLVD